MKVTSKDLLNEAYKLMCTDIRGLDQEDDSLNEDAGAWIVIGVYVGYLALIIGASALCAHLTRKNAARQATAVDREEFTAAIEYLKKTWFDEFKDKTKAKFSAYVAADGIEFVSDILAKTVDQSNAKSNRNDALVYHIPIANINYSKIVKTLASKEQAKFNSSINNAKTMIENIGDAIIDHIVGIFEVAKKAHPILRDHFCVFIDGNGTQGTIYIGTQIDKSIVFSDSKYLKK